MEIDSSDDITLWNGPKERSHFEDMADLYSIIKTTQHLEKAYVRDLISADEYTAECQRLIAQFRTTEAALKNDNTITDVRSFISKYKMDCPLAVERLLVAGVPATVLHSHTDAKSKQANVIVAEATQAFITAMDTVRLNMRSVDNIQPLINDLVKAVNKCDVILSGGFEKKKLQDWLITLNSMKAIDELDDAQMRQLGFDLEGAYQDFVHALKN